MEERKKEPIIRISNDEMQAYLTLPAPGSGEFYTVETVRILLQSKGVRAGYIEENLQQIVKDQIYGYEMPIAKGIPAVDGVDAFYQFNFNLETNGKPLIRPDGTVDYWSIHAIEVVEAGQVIAVYTEPTQGSDGMTVTGKKKIGKRGRPLPPLTGRGFERSEDGLVYTATQSGKIEKRENRIMISSVYEVRGDADQQHTGNINFRGDVVIHGNVNVGVVIHATGSVTVDGTAEACEIYAGKDIILRGGLLGAGRAILEAQGNIFAKFIEYASIVCEGSMEVNSLLDCNVVCYDRLSVDGKHASIIGGNVFAARGIQSFCIGNHSEIATEVQVGTNSHILSELLNATKRIEDCHDMINKLNVGLEQIDEFARENHVDMRSDERRMALLRTRIVQQAELAKAEDAKNRVEAIIAKSKGATIRVVHDVFPGVSVGIDGNMIKVKESQKAVEFKEMSGHIVMISMRGELVG